MRKIVVYELLSLDGVAEEPDSFFADWDDAMDVNLAAVIGTQDAVILGRRSYNEPMSRPYERNASALAAMR